MSSEARRNTIALLIVALILLVFGAFAFRPAVVLPVSDAAVAGSLDSAADSLHTQCLHAADGFRCTVRIDGDSDSSASSHRLRVHVDWDGCWRAAEENATHSPLRESGCVHLWNY